MLQTSDEFARALVGSRLFSHEEIQDFWQSLPDDDRPTSARQFADLLTSREKITPFQADEILRERRLPLILDDYILLERLGEGGMGEVYKARHRRMKRIVALKLIGPWLTSEAVIKRFHREAEAAGKLAHPNIVATFDAGEDRGHHYLAMEFVEGATLHQLATTSLAPQQVIGYLRQAAEGLAFAHANGVIHRDVKPANLIVDKGGRLRILDMGIARIDQPLAEDGLTRTGDLMGTADYMAPEQWSDIRKVDGRCDIYSLGCTLFELLAGRVMYAGDTPYAKARSHEQDPIPSLRDYCPGITAEFDGIFRRMVAKKPQDRFATMVAVRDALASAEKQYAGHQARRVASLPWLGILNAFWGASRSSAKSPRARSKSATNDSVSAIVVDPSSDNDSGHVQTFGTLAPDDGRAESVATVRAANDRTVTELRRRADGRGASKIGVGSRARILLVSVALVVVLLGGLIAYLRRPTDDTAQRMPATAPERASPPIHVETTTPQKIHPVLPATTPIQPVPPSTPAKSTQPVELTPLPAARPQTDTTLAWKLLYGGQFLEAEREATKVLDVSPSLSAHICRARAREQLNTDDLEPAESDVKAVADATDAERKSLTEDELLQFYRVAADLKRLRGERAARKSDLQAARVSYLDALRYYELALKIRPQLDYLQESCRDLRAKIDHLPSL